MHNQRLFSSWHSYPDLSDRDTFRVLLRAIFIIIIIASACSTLLYFLNDLILKSVAVDVTGYFKSLPYLFVDFGLGLFLVAYSLRYTSHLNNHGLGLLVIFLLMIPVALIKEALNHLIFLSYYHSETEEFKRSVSANFTLSYDMVFSTLLRYLYLFGFFAASLSPVAFGKRRWYFIYAACGLMAIKIVSQFFIAKTYLWTYTAIFEVFHLIVQVSIPFAVLWLLIRNPKVKWVPKYPIVKSPPRITAWLLLVVSLFVLNYYSIMGYHIWVGQNSWAVWGFAITPYVLSILLLYKNNLKLLFVIGVLFRIISIFYLFLGLYSVLEAPYKPVLFLYGALFLIPIYIVSKERTSWDSWRIQQRTLTRKEAENL